MILKHFYMWNLYSDKDVNIDDWNNLHNKKFVECFSPSESWKFSYIYLNFRSMVIIKKVQ